MLLQKARSEVAVPEVLVEFPEIILTKDGRGFQARAMGAEADDGMWHGWVEFTPLDGGAAVESGRETTQPNRVDTVYWATGLTPIYLEGSLERALHPHVTGSIRPIQDVPPAAGGDTSVLNPFAVYRKGETLLRRQLSALSSWHLVNIITAYGLSDQSPSALAASSPEVLIELIVLQVGAEATATARTDRNGL
jgi:hypothetical protein